MADVDHAIALLYRRTLDRLISECLDDNRKPKAPSMKTLMDACRILPAGCNNTLIKVPKDETGNKTIP